MLLELTSLRACRMSRAITWANTGWQRSQCSPWS